MKIEEKNFGKKRVVVYQSENKNAPIIYSNDYSECGETLIEKCKEMNIPDFNLVTISHLSWDQEMSPWPHEPVVAANDHFTGKADEYMELLKKEIIPYAESVIGSFNGKRILSGYSMAGLFAAYAPFITDFFDAFICVSASVWYPDFRDYFCEHDFKKKIDAMYFSIGDKETQVKNPALQVTDKVMQDISAECIRRGTKSTFEYNPGNHFKDGVLRVAMGVSWTLNQLP